MALPSEWIERLFTRLELAYGHRFLSQWPGIDPAVVKADWAEKLDGFENHREALQFALANLPADNPVNAMQFRDLARRAPDKPVKALPAPPPDKSKAAEALAMARAAFSRKGDRLDTLRELAESDARDGTYRGRPVTLAQRQTYRQALGMNREAA